MIFRTMWEVMWTIYMISQTLFKLNFKFNICITTPVKQMENIDLLNGRDQ